MSAFRSSVVVAALGFAVLAATPARADLIIYVDGVQQVDDPTNTLASVTGAFGNFNINVLTALGINSFGGSGELLDVSALDVDSTGSGTLQIIVTETNLSAGQAAQFVEDFTGNLNNITATRAFYLDTTNSGLETTLLGKTSTGGSVTLSEYKTLNGMFSITEEIDLTAKGRGATLSSDDEVSIPEPTTLGLLGMGILALGVMGRRRKRLKSA